MLRLTSLPRPLVVYLDKNLVINFENIISHGIDNVYQGDNRIIRQISHYFLLACC